MGVNFLWKWTSHIPHRKSISKPMKGKTDVTKKQFCRKLLHQTQEKGVFRVRMLVSTTLSSFSGFGEQIVIYLNMSLTGEKSTKLGTPKTPHPAVGRSVQKTISQVQNAANTN